MGPSFGSWERTLEEEYTVEGEVYGLRHPWVLPLWVFSAKEGVCSTTEHEIHTSTGLHSITTIVCIHHAYGGRWLGLVCWLYLLCLWELVGFWLLLCIHHGYGGRLGFFLPFACCHLFLVSLSSFLSYLMQSLYILQIVWLCQVCGEVHLHSIIILLSSCGSKGSLRMFP